MLVVIFDWDDTLMASTYLEGKAQHEDTLPDLACSILATIAIAKQYGQEVHIITNATRDWFLYCLEKFLPGCEHLPNEVRFTSTVSEGLNYQDVSAWKSNAFSCKLSPCFGDGQTHDLISFGDSDYDRRAAWHVKKLYPNVRTKSVLLQKKPTLDQLLCQQRAIRQLLSLLIQKEGDLDLRLEPVLVEIPLREDEGNPEPEDLQFALEM